MDPNKALNMTMLCDFYELTMGNGYLEHDMQDRITYFDVFIRYAAEEHIEIRDAVLHHVFRCVLPQRTG